MILSKIHWQLDKSMSKDEIKNSNLYSYRTRIFPTLNKFKYHVSASYEFNPNAEIVLIPLITQNYDYVLNNIKKYKLKDSIVILDYTDNHYFIKSPHQYFYSKIFNCNLINLVIINSFNMADTVKQIFKGQLFKIDEVLEISPQPLTPVRENNIFWFGHISNFKFLINKLQFWPNASFDKLVIMTNFTEAYANKYKNIIINCIKEKKFKTCKIYPFSPTGLINESRICNKIIIPSSITDELKSNVSSNRLITAFALGKMVAATKIGSYLEFSKYFIDIDDEKEFTNFIKQDFQEELVKKAIKNVLPNYEIIAIQKKWEELLEKFIL